MIEDFFEKTGEAESEKVDADLGFDAETLRILIEAFQQQGKVRMEFSGKPHFPSATVRDMDSLKLVMKQYHDVFFLGSSIDQKRAMIRFKPLLEPNYSEFSHTKMTIVTLVPDKIRVFLKSSGRPHTVDFVEEGVHKNFGLRLTIDVPKLKVTQQRVKKERQHFFPNLKFPPIVQKFTISRPRSESTEHAQERNSEEIRRDKDIKEFLANDSIRVFLPREAVRQYLLSIPIAPEMEENRKRNVDAVLAHHIGRDIPLKIARSSTGSIFVEYRGQSVEVTPDSLAKDQVIPLDERVPLLWTFGEKTVMLFLAEIAERDPEFLQKLQTQSEAALYLSDLTGIFLKEKTKKENERWREWHEESDANIIHRIYRYIPLDTGYGYVDIKQDSTTQVDTIRLNDPELLGNKNVVTGKKEVAVRISMFRAQQFNLVDPVLEDPVLLVSEIRPGEFLLKVFAFSKEEDTAHANPDTLRLRVMSPQEVEMY